jgi:hypothetical protein
MTKYFISPVRSENPNNVPDAFVLPINAENAQTLRKMVEITRIQQHIAPDLLIDSAYHFKGGKFIASEKASVCNELNYDEGVIVDDLPDCLQGPPEKLTTCYRAVVGYRGDIVFQGDWLYGVFVESCPAFIEGIEFALRESYADPVKA